ncbi:hypothetical protein QP794_07640 [Paenibacillus sp. UMB7766-LJ446]|nr:hypothetical protein [Paenibacillus sp. UMB7766-LJ446]
MRHVMGVIRGQSFYELSQLLLVELFVMCPTWALSLGFKSRMAKAVVATTSDGRW